MEIKKYNEMMSYLTRPGTPEEDNRRIEQENKFKKAKQENYQKDQTHLENYVKRTTALNEKPGAFKRLVKENELEDARNNQLMNTAIEKSSTPVKGYPKPDIAMEKRGQQTVALTNTAKGHLRKQIKNGNIKREDMLLKEDDNGLMVNKNRTIAIRDSFIAKQFNRALGVKTDEPMATPEQVGKLAERLEKNAQMTGGKGLFTEIADNLGKKPIIKKPINKTPSKPFKFPEFKIDPILPHIYKPSTPDPEFLRQERNFQRMIEESNKPKGLPGILGLKKSDYE
jgi:hypothetical protein